MGGITGTEMPYYDQPLNPPPTQSGYVFNGWWTAKKNGTRVHKGTLVKNSRTYYAHWTQESESTHTIDKYVAV